MTAPCLCKRPQPGPLYWDWRCRQCSGHIVGWWTRRKLRRRALDARVLPADFDITEHVGGLGSGGKERLREGEQ